MRKRNTSQGFTLIEILVVIAIIAVLTAIVYSAFFVVRKRSADTICISHLRQIGIALKMYAQDYDDYPRYNDFFPRALEQIYPVYLTDFRLLKCPNVPESIGPGADRTNYGYLYKMKSPPLPKDEPPGPAMMTWEEAYRHRGESLPLVDCNYHGLDLKNTPAETYSNGKLQLRRMSIVLRMDGSVSKSMTLYKWDEHGTLHHFWYDD